MLRHQSSTTAGSQQIDTARRHVCRPTSGGPQTCSAASADRNESAASTSEARTRNHDARPGQVSFDERSFKVATLAVESFGRLGEEGNDMIDLVAASI